MSNLSESDIKNIRIFVKLMEQQNKRLVVSWNLFNKIAIPYTKALSQCNECLYDDNMLLIPQYAQFSMYSMKNSEFVNIEYIRSYLKLQIFQ